MTFLDLPGWGWALPMTRHSSLDPYRDGTTCLVIASLLYIGVKRSTQGTRAGLPRLSPQFRPVQVPACPGSRECPVGGQMAYQTPLSSSFTASPGRGRCRCNRCSRPGLGGRIRGASEDPALNHPSWPGACFSTLFHYCPPKEPF